MKIKRHQVVAFVNLQEKENVSSFHEFGTLEEFGLPEAKTNILTFRKEEKYYAVVQNQKGSGNGAIPKIQKSVCSRQFRPWMCTECGTHHYYQ